MPNLKISELPELTDSSVANNGITNDDFLTILDISELSPGDQNKKVKVSTLHEFLAPLNSPSFTGLPVAPTPLLSDDSTRISTTAYVKNAIAEVTDYIDTEILTTGTAITNATTSANTYTDDQIDLIKLNDLADVNTSNLISTDNNRYLSYNHTTTSFSLGDKAGTDVGNVLKLINVAGDPGLPILNGSNLTNLNIPIGAGAPLTTKGDIYVFGTTFQRLPVGTDDKSLVADSTSATGMSWKEVQGTNLQTFAAPISSSFSLFDSYHGQLIRINTNLNNVTVTFATGIRQGYQVTLFNAGVNQVIINPNGQLLLSRGLNLINNNSACSLSYNALTSTWFGIGDLS
jgi:hypothetical protein